MDDGRMPRLVVVVVMTVPLVSKCQSVYSSPYLSIIYLSIYPPIYPYQI